MDCILYRDAIHFFIALIDFCGNQTIRSIVILYQPAAFSALFDFYKKLWFNKTLYRNEICVSFDNKKSTMDFVEKHGNDAYEIYVNSLPKDLSCPLKNREVFEFSLFASGGNFYTFPCGYLVYDGQTVCEICTTKESMENVLQNASRFFKRDLKAYTFFDVGEKEPYAVLCELADSKISDSVYANMLMD